MSKSKAPPPPDYAAAAEQTAAGNLEMARYNTLANRPNSFYPGGSRTWTQGGEPQFDQEGYDQAMAAYNASAQPSSYMSSNMTNQGIGNPASSASGQPSSYMSSDMTNQGIGNPAYYGPNNGPEESSSLMNNAYMRRPIGGQQQAPPPQGGPPNRSDYETIPNPDKWTETVSLSPEGQKAFDIGERNTTKAAQLGSQALDQAGNIINTPFSIDGEVPKYRGASGQMPGYQGPEGELGQYGAHRQQVMDAMMNRVNTDVGRDRESRRSQLISQGIPEGSEAFERQMEQLDRKQTDARQQAEIAAEQMAGMGYASDIAGRQQMGKEGMDLFGTGMDVRNQYNQEGMNRFNTGMQSRQQGIQEALLERQTPINEFGAMRTGSQVGMPQFQQFGQQPMVGGPNYSQAAGLTGQYNLGAANQDTAQGNAMMGGLFGLGAAGIGAFPWGR